MEEKVLITSNNDYAQKLKGLTGKVAIASPVIAIVMFFLVSSVPLPSAISGICALGFYVFLIVTIIAIPLFIFSISISQTSITVTNKRVYGATVFGKRVDLPFDSVSAVGVSFFNGIAIGTSSGQIFFRGIGNRDDIHKVISKLLVERQEKKTVEKVAPKNSIDDLKKYKDLLDNGIITQEEFDAKKKQLLDL